MDEVHPREIEQPGNRKWTHAEFRELNGPASVDVHLVDHVLDLGVCRVLAQGPHHRREFLEEKKFVF